MLLADLMKGRRPGGKYVAAYRVFAKKGTSYIRKFYTEDEHTKFLHNAAKKGTSYQRLEAHELPLDMQARDSKEEIVSLDPAEVAQKRAEDFDTASIHKFKRVGDKIPVLAPGLLGTAKWLHQARARLAKLQNKSAKLRNTAFQRLQSGDKAGAAEANEQAAGYSKRAKSYASLLDRKARELAIHPLGVRASRIAAIKMKLAELRDIGRQEVEDNPDLLSDWKRRARANKRKDEAAPPEPRGLPETEGEIDRLERILERVKGTAVHTRKFVPRVSGARFTKLAPVADVGVSPTTFPASYALTMGAWKNVGADGLNVFSNNERDALYNEFSGIISSIVNGKAWKEGVRRGWFSFIDGGKAELKDELKQTAVLALFDAAHKYSAPKAEEKLDAGVNFVQYAKAYIDAEVRRFLLKVLDEAVQKRKAEPQVLQEVQDAFVDDERDLTHQQLGDTGLPKESRYLTGEEVIAIQDARRLLTKYLDPVETALLFSRLNLFSATKTAKDEGGLKSWDEMARDMAAATGKNLGFWKQRVQPQWTQALTRLKFSVQDGKIKGEDAAALQAGLKLMLDAFVNGKKVPVDTRSWRREISLKRIDSKNFDGTVGASVPHTRAEDVVRKLSSRKRGDRGIIDQIIRNREANKFLTLERHGSTPASNFWTAKRKQFESKEFDPVAAFGLDLSFADHASVPNISLPSGMASAKARAHSYMKAWKALSSLSDGKLKTLANHSAFKKYEEARLHGAFGSLKLYGVSIPSEVAPGHIATMAHFIREGRATSTKKSLSAHDPKEEIVEFLRKLIEALEDWQ